MKRDAFRRALARGAVLAAACAVAGALAGAAAPAAGAATLQGTVTAAGAPLASARVTLFGASSAGAAPLGDATTDGSGRFTIPYEPGAATALYVDATSPGARRLRLRAVVGAPSAAPATVAIGELSTVAAAFALAQFSGADGVAGPSTGLENAAATAHSLVDPADGTAGAVVTNADNGSSNATLATLNTLADLVSLCAPGGDRDCERLMAGATPPGGAAPADTAQAMVDLARNPMLGRATLWALARRAPVHTPALDRPPSAWMLVLLHTAEDLYASGRIALDANGNVWSSTNWLPGTRSPSTSITALDPVGAPAFGSPIAGGGMKGGAWGAAISPGDGSVWMGSFGGDAIAQYSPEGAPVSPAAGWTDGALDHPQGMAFDQRGNLWIANNYGPESAPGQGSVVVYQGGDPSKAITITGGGLNHPFAVQIDGYGRAWVTNAGPGGAKLVGTRAALLVGKFAGSVTVIGPDFRPTSSSPIEDPSFRWPLGLAIDSGSNAWTANYFSSTVTQIRPDGTVARVIDLPRGTLPWSQAIDGSDRVWVAGFGRPGVWLFCGVDTDACPPGATTGSRLSPATGFTSAAFQHFTSIQLDQAGNVWLSNNWSQLDPPVGGVGIAEIVGAATPVCAPLAPLPTRPSSTGTPCPQQQAAALPASLDGDGGGGVPGWAWVAIAAIVATLAAVVTVVRRRTAVRS